MTFAEAHFRLGRLLGQTIGRFVPDTDSAVVVLERGGRFFGDGVYTGFGGVFYSYNPKKDDLPSISQDNIIIVDSVINTGKSVLNLTDRLKKANPNAEIFIAANVVQRNAVNLMKEYKLFAVRTSANCFVGSRQAAQINGLGPDTADRLFNYIPQ